MKWIAFRSREHETDAERARWSGCRMARLIRIRAHLVRHYSARALADHNVSNANTSLVFPEDPDLRQLSGKRIPLTFGPRNPKSRGGHPVLVDPEAEVINIYRFRHLRVKLGAWIENCDVPRVREALDVQYDEPGILELSKRNAIELP
jgi:hypothetical protein